MKTIWELRTYLIRLDPRMIYYRRLARSHLPDVLATVDMESFNRLKVDARRKSPVLFYLKYFNLGGYMREHLARALSLGLHRSRRLNILDVGAGFGFFSYVCDYFGHYPHALDVPEVPLFDEVTDFFRIKKTHCRIRAFERLPDMGTKFDLIASIQLGFHGLTRDTVWGVEEWQFFLEDILQNQLKPGGRIFFELNYDHRLHDYLPKEIDQLFAKYGARRRGGNRIIMQAPPASDPVRETGTISHIGLAKAA